MSSDSQPWAYGRLADPSAKAEEIGEQLREAMPSSFRVVMNTQTPDTSRGNSPSLRDQADMLRLMCDMGNPDLDHLQLLTQNDPSTAEWNKYQREFASRYPEYRARRRAEEQLAEAQRET